MHIRTDFDYNTSVAGKKISRGKEVLLCLIRTRITTVSRIISRTSSRISRTVSRTSRRKISRTVRTARTTVQKDKCSDIFCNALYFIFMRYGALFYLIFRTYFLIAIMKFCQILITNRYRFFISGRKLRFLGQF